VPVFVIDQVACAVVELSERGLRFVAVAQQPGAGRPLAGVLRFADGTELLVEGTVSRFVAGSVAMRLTRGVSLGRMLAEQRRIIRNYPDFPPRRTRMSTIRASCGR
jgi:hypothetical protein